jgi:hypothetical protein
MSPRTNGSPATNSSASAGVRSTAIVLTGSSGRSEEGTRHQQPTVRMPLLRARDVRRQRVRSKPSRFLDGGVLRL